MSFNISTARWCVYGCKGRPYNSYQHIQSGFYEALKYMGKEVTQYDHLDDLSNIDFSNTVFLALGYVLEGIPNREDCYYAVHNPDPNYTHFINKGKMLDFGVHCSTNVYSPRTLELDLDTYFDPDTNILQFRWGTDILPPAIEVNKPTKVFNSDSKIYNYVATIDPGNKLVIEEFSRAVRENGIEVKYFGGYSGYAVVSSEENERLIKESYMAPSLQNDVQLKSGYVPCRVFKALSYGQFPLTHSPHVQKLFKNRLIYNPNTYDLFYQAKEQLSTMPLSELHSLMDLVRDHHTYVNKVSAVIKAIKILEGETI